MKYKLIDYFDVWGNAEDGWEVNNLITVEEEIYISEDTTDEELINYLINIGYLRKNVNEENITIESSDNTFIELFQTYDMLPLGRLEAIR